MTKILFKGILMINIVVFCVLIVSCMRLCCAASETPISLSVSDVCFFIDDEEAYELKNGKVTVTASLNNKSNTESVDAVLALYEKSGCLKRIKIETILLKDSIQTISITDEITNIDEGDNLRLFVFYSMESLIPVANEENEKNSISTHDMKEAFFDNFENGLGKWCRADDGYLNFDTSSGRLVSTDLYSNTKAQIADLKFGRFILDFDFIADFSRNGSYFRIELWNGERSEWIIFRNNRVSFYNGKTENIIGTTNIISDNEYGIQLRCWGSSCDVYLKTEDTMEYIGGTDDISIESERSIVFGQNNLNLNIDNVSVKVPDIRLIRTSPANSECNVNKNTEVLLEFNDYIRQDTLNPCSIIVYGESGMPEYSIAADRKCSCRIVFKSPLEDGEKYTVRLKGGSVKDIYGQSIEECEFSFQVYAKEETVYLKSTMPYDGEENVDIRTSVTIDFSSAIGELPKEAFCVSGDRDFELIKLNAKKYIIRFVKPLEPETQYIINIKANGMLEQSASFGFTTASGTIRAGAIYFNGWGDTRHEMSQFNGNLVKAYPEREPIWGYNNNSSEYMEKEIASASAGGLDYFSFLFYPSDDSNVYGDYKTNPLNKCFENYLNADNKNMMQWCIYFANHDSFRPDTEGWVEVIDYIFDRGWFNDDMYLKADGKPVVIVFDQDNFNADVRAYLREKMSEAGFEDCILIGRGTSSGEGWDGHTQYNIQSGYGERTQEQLRNDNLNYLGTAKEADKIIVFAENGWDKRAWKFPSVRYYTGRDSEEFCLNLKSVRSWMISNPEKCISDLLLINAWNEMGEGGYLIPNVSEGENHLKAVAKALYNEDYIKTPSSFPMFSEATTEAEHMGMGTVIFEEANFAACEKDQTGAVWGTFCSDDGLYMVKVRYSGTPEQNMINGLYVGGCFIGGLLGEDDGNGLVCTYNVRLKKNDIIKVIIDGNTKIDNIEISEI